nr:hypothetical protein [Rhodobacter capsulatus]
MQRLGQSEQAAQLGRGGGKGDAAGKARTRFCAPRQRPALARNGRGGGAQGLGQFCLGQIEREPMPLRDPLGAFGKSCQQRGGIKAQPGVIGAQALDDRSLRAQSQRPRWRHGKRQLSMGHGGDRHRHPPRAAQIKAAAQPGNQRGAKLGRPVAGGPEQAQRDGQIRALRIGAQDKRFGQLEARIQRALRVVKQIIGAGRIIGARRPRQRLGRGGKRQRMAHRAAHPAERGRALCKPAMPRDLNDEVASTQGGKEIRERNRLHGAVFRRAEAKIKPGVFAAAKGHCEGGKMRSGRGRKEKPPTGVEGLLAAYRFAWMFAR